MAESVTAAQNNHYTGAKTKSQLFKNTIDTTQVPEDLIIKINS